MIEFISALIILTSLGLILCFTKTTKQTLLLKGALIVSLIISSLYIFSAITRYAGKPVETNIIEDDIIVYTAIVDVGNKKIHIWYSPIISGQIQPLPPLSVSVDYMKNVHRAIQDGKQKNGGGSFRLQFKNRMSDKKKGSGKDGKGGGNSQCISLSSETDINLEDFPAPKMPKKEE